jgi:hypothetical protein
MFGHHELEWGHILDLPPLDDLPSYPVQGTLAGVTGSRAMQHPHIGNCDLGQGLSSMTGLSSRFPLTPHPLAAPTTAQPIAGRGLAAVVAIFGQPQEQVPHLGLQGRHLLLQVRDLALLGSILCF